MMNGKPNGHAILPAAEQPVSGMKMLVTVRNDLLTIEFEKKVDWLQFNKADATRFVQGLAAHIKAMK